MRIGNNLVGNDECAAGIEIQTFPFRLTFSKPTAFAVTGGDACAKLDGVDLPPWWTMVAQPGQELHILPPKSFARAYVAFGGGIGLAPVLGSRSTSLRGSFGGLDGRPLAMGDTLPLGDMPLSAVPAEGFGIVPPMSSLVEAFPRDDNGTLLIRALPAAEHDAFGDDATRFWAQDWTISSQSDRTGFRLTGAPIQPMTRVEMRSHGVMPGVIQVPPGGEPIVQMSDANTAGGYPKIAGVIEADLWRLGQARIGSRLRFVKTTHREAKALEAILATCLTDTRDNVALVREALRVLSGA